MGIGVVYLQRENTHTIKALVLQPLRKETLP